MMPDPELAARFAGDGYVAPLTALAPDAAARIVAGLAPLLDANGRAAAPLRNNPHLLFTWADALIDHPRIVDAVSALIGPDLLVRDSVLFAKGPRDQTRVDWHQDGANWEIDGDRVVTAWLALTDAHPGNGVMRVLPGSHRGPRLRHAMGRDAAGRLIRSRAVAPIDERQLVCVTLRAGEFSVHDKWLLHGSADNPSDTPRIGLAIRYVAPETRERVLGGAATLVAGRDPHAHWALRPRPRHDHDPRSAAWHRRALRRYALHVAWQIVREPSPSHLRLLGHLARRELARTLGRQAE